MRGEGCGRDEGKVLYCIEISVADLERFYMDPDTICFVDTNMDLNLSEKY